MGIIDDLVDLKITVETKQKLEIFVQRLSWIVRNLTPFKVKTVEPVEIMATEPVPVDTGEIYTETPLSFDEIFTAIIALHPEYERTICIDLDMAAGESGTETVVKIADYITDLGGGFIGLLKHCKEAGDSCIEYAMAMDATSRTAIVNHRVFARDVELARYWKINESIYITATNNDAGSSAYAQILINIIYYPSTEYERDILSMMKDKARKLLEMY